jgi:hypothetical protein
MVEKAAYNAGYNLQKESDIGVMVKTYQAGSWLAHDKSLGRLELSIHDSCMCMYVHPA